ncbi:hypothetical protein Save01_07233 [Streptomyces avermitilis]
MVPGAVADVRYGLQPADGPLPQWELIGVNDRRCSL